MQDSDLPLPPLPHLGDKFTLEETQHYAREAVRAAVERERAESIKLKYVWCLLGEDESIVPTRSDVIAALDEAEERKEPQAKAEKGLEPVVWILPLDIGRDCGTTAKQVSDEQIPLTYAHPPTQVEPVASKSVEDCMRLADAYLNAKLIGADPLIPRTALQAAIVAYGDAQWNAAIEVAEDEAQYEKENCAAYAATAIRGLKRGPHPLDDFAHPDSVR